MSADQPAASGHQHPGHEHSRATCGLPSMDEPPLLVGRLNVYASAAGLTTSFSHSPLLEVSKLAEVLTVVAEALRQGEYLVDPLFCGHEPGTCSCNGGSPS